MGLLGPIFGTFLATKGQEEELGSTNAVGLHIGPAPIDLCHLGREPFS